MFLVIDICALFADGLGPFVMYFAFCAFVHLPGALSSAQSRHGVRCIDVRQWMLNKRIDLRPHAQDKKQPSKHFVFLYLLYAPARARVGAGCVLYWGLTRPRPGLAWPVCVPEACAYPPCHTAAAVLIVMWHEIGSSRICVNCGSLWKILPARRKLGANFGMARHGAEKSKESGTNS